MLLKEEIALFIKERRLELGLTMEELAILVWEDPTQKSEISRYENCKRSMNIDTLELILKALKTELILSRK
ncbi:MAG: helix-turn-helix transcriptional regulator [Flavobacteriaceae bacterium]|jgi:transcriptional regulator with XRE-family HTH domain|nr:helix-turn-helix transcriptional regulator [Flavobacteriaceae bacterium]